MSNHRPYSYRTTVRVGENHQTTIWPRPGLFIYSGLGVGNYYSTSMRVVECTPVDAKDLARREGVELVYRDYKSSDFSLYQTMKKWPIKADAYMTSDGKLHEQQKEAEEYERKLEWSDWYMERPVSAVVGPQEVWDWLCLYWDDLENIINKEQ